LIGERPPINAGDGISATALFAVALSFLEGNGVKTKKISHVDLSAKCFLLVPDPESPKTWRLPVHIPGDTAKTINQVKSCLARFHEMRDIPAGQRSALWNRLIGAATVLGIPVAKDPIVAVTEEEIDLILAERNANDLVGKLNLDWTSA
jgi:hypothetical protein